jgi:hypothetical protein
LALAVASLALRSVPTHDPWAWVVFGRELVVPGLGFSPVAGTGWKPLAVLFSAPLALFGPGAPSLWLVVVRCAGLAAMALAGLGRPEVWPLVGVYASLRLAAAADHGRPWVGPLTTQLDRFRDPSSVSFGVFRTEAHALESVGLED